MGNRTVLDIDIFDSNVLGDLATCVLTSLPPKCVFSRDETTIVAESMHVVQVPSIGGFGGWWAWFPQEKVCIFSGKNFVILQTASQDWCLEDGYLKFSCRKKTLPRCHVISGTACLCLNPISSVFSLRKMDLKKLHDATLPINWCKSYPRQSNCSGSIVFCFNNFPKGVGLVVL